MGLLNPILAVFGTLAVSIPIIIHLLNRRKFERVVWAAMRFLKVSVEKNQRRIQIEDILLLVLRCLMLFLLGLALSRPTLGCSAASAVLGNQEITGVMILDNSYSMSGTDGVKSRFEQAKMAADQLLNTLPGGSSIAVILASDIANPVIPEPTHDLVKVRRTIDEAKLSSRGSNLYPSIKHAIDTLQGRSAVRKEIYLFTDGQAVAWHKLGEIETLLEKEKSNLRASVVLVGGHEEQNVAVSQLRMASGVAAVNRELRFEAEIHNYGQKAAENVRVTLRVDAAEPSDEQTIALIPEGASKTVALHAKLREEGFHTVTAAIPADHLPADDVRTIALRAVTQVKVLLVDGSPSGRARDSETYFLQQALLPVVPGMVDQYFVKVTTVSPAELDAQKFDTYDAIFLANVADFSQRAMDGFADYLRRGGGLIIFPGDATGAAFYNANLSARYHFLPATLGPAHGDAAKEDRYFTINPKQFQHPIASIWADAASGPPVSAKFFKAYELNPVDDGLKQGEKPKEGDQNSQYAAEAGKPRVVLRFGPGVGDDSLNNKPAMMERTWGLGRVVLFSSTASSRWTNLPGRGIFLPLIDRTLASIVQRQDEALNIRVGDTFVFHPGDESIGKEALFFKPSQKDEATDSRQIELTRGGVPTVSYDQTDVAGEYIVKMPYGNPIKFAAQTETDNNESSLEELNQAQTDQLAAVCGVMRWSPGDRIESKMEAVGTGRELWTQLAWIVLALAVGETLLAQWFSRAK